MRPSSRHLALTVLLVVRVWGGKDSEDSIDQKLDYRTGYNNIWTEATKSCYTEFETDIPGVYTEQLWYCQGIGQNGWKKKTEQGGHAMDDELKETSSGSPDLYPNTDHFWVRAVPPQDVHLNCDCEVEAEEEDVGWSSLLKDDRFPALTTAQLACLPDGWVDFYNDDNRLSSNVWNLESINICSGTSSLEAGGAYIKSPIWPMEDLLDSILFPGNADDGSGRRANAWMGTPNHLDNRPFDDGLPHRLNIDCSCISVGPSCTGSPNPNSALYDVLENTGSTDGSTVKLKCKSGSPSATIKTTCTRGVWIPDTDLTCFSGSQSGCVAATSTIYAQLYDLDFGSTCTSAASANAVCPIRCRQGTTFQQGSPSLTCIFGVWTTTLQCTPTRCTVPTGQLTTDGSCPAELAYGENCALECVRGHHLDWGASLAMLCRAETARENAVPNDDHGRCVPDECDLPVTHQYFGQFNSFSRLSCRSLLLDNGKCDLECADGYYNRGSTRQTLTCTLGEVNTVNMDCQPACQPWRPPTNQLLVGTCAQSQFLEPDGPACEPQCTSGYSSNGRLEVSCLADSTWSSVRGECLPNSCSQSPPLVQGATFPCNGVEHGKACTYQCQNGLRPKGDLTITCEKGAWSRVTGSCVEFACLGPPELPTGYRVAGECDYQAGGGCALGCASGFTPKTQSPYKNDFIVTCINGGWTKPQFGCGSKCNSLPQLPGRVRNNDCVLPVADGESCNVQCASGYVSKESTAITCVSGEWTAPKIECHAKCAGLPRRIAELGMTAGTCRADSSDDCNVQCNPATHTLPNGANTRVTCTDGVWGDIEFFCLPKPCSLTLPPGFARGSCSDQLQTGEACVLSCADGYPPADSEAGLLVRCDLGTLSAPTAQCNGESRLCSPPDLSVSQGAGYALGGCDKPFYEEGKQCTLRCKDGYTSSKTATMSCDGDTGQMIYVGSGQMPTCNKQCHIPLAVREDTGLQLNGCAVDADSGSKCTIKCDNGAASWQLECVSGVWKRGNQPAFDGTMRCDRMPCKKRDLPAGTGNVLDDCGEETASDDTCFYACGGASSHPVSGATVCTDGRWTAKNPVACLAASCLTSSLASALNVVIDDSCPERLEEGGECGARCANGYKQTGGGKKVQCDSGEMNTDIECQAGCVVPSATEAASHSLKWSCGAGKTVESGDACDLSCTEGFSLEEKNGRVRCVHGEWEGLETIICKENECGDPSNLFANDGKAIGGCGPGPHNTVCETGCDWRTFSPTDVDAFILRCVNGEWKDRTGRATPKPVCKRRECGEHPVFQGNPRVHKGNCKFPSDEECDLECNPGFQKQGGNKVKCVMGDFDTQAWSDSSIQCLAPCQIPIDFLAVQGRVLRDCKPGDTIQHGDACQAECQPGFTGNGVQVKCADGVLSNLGAVKCEESKCGGPPALPNDAVLGSCGGEQRDSGMSCTAGCKPGFKPSPPSTTTLTCSRGAWSRADFSCKLAKCDGRPAYCSVEGVAVGGCQGKDDVGSRCSMECKEGWELTGGTLAVECGTSGVWTAPSGTCSKQCPLPSILSAEGFVKGTCNKKFASVGDRCLPACDTGYSRQGQAQELTCSEEGWSDISWTCRKDCVPPVVAAPLELGRCGGRKHLEVCDLECASGYEALGNQQITCRDGGWTAPTFTCKPNKCGRLTKLPGIALIGKCDVATAETGFSCSLACPSGHSADATLVVCNKGVWEMPAADCRPNGCRPARVEGVGNRLQGNCARGPVADKASCRPQCKPGYEPSPRGASLDIQCDKGVWSTPVTCVEKGCPLAPPVGDFTIRGDCPAANAPADTVCSLACAPSYAARGDMSMRCSEGVWSRQVGTCIVPRTSTVRCFPKHGATKVSFSPKVEFLFSSPVQRMPAGVPRVTLQKKGGGNVNLNMKTDLQSGNIIAIKPSVLTQLEPLTEYTATLSDRFLDQEGKWAVGQTTCTWTTASQQPVNRPTPGTGKDEDWGSGHSKRLQDS